MHKYRTATAATLVVAAAALLVPGRAEAGASASAPSKYTNATQAAFAHQVRADRQARRNDFAITEYSSSSARSHSQQR
jgi:hypothetical protein